MSFGARALIRLGALKHNFQVIQKIAPGARIMAVVKANAYGHGLLPVANALGDADCFGVARINEARALRQDGIRQPILLLSGDYTEAELASGSFTAFGDLKFDYKDRTAIFSQFAYGPQGILN